MFDIVKVGRKISELRKGTNMTQFELADKLGISFQAVSNWERGNSMPDISKLPEIAELFDVSIDEILGKKNSILNEVIKGTKVKLDNHSESDVNDAANLMKPQQIKEMIDFSEYNPRVISSLLPFLDYSYIEDLMNEFKNAGKGISIFLPFLSYEKIDELVNETIEKGESINAFLPFIREQRVKKLAFDAFNKGGLNEASPYLPFLNEKDIIILTGKIFSQDKNNNL